MPHQRRLLLLLLAFVFQSKALSAQLVKWVVVITPTSETDPLEGTGSTIRVRSLSYAQALVSFESLVKDLDPNGLVSEHAVAKSVIDSARGGSDESSRWVSQRGDRMALYVCGSVKDIATEVKISEEKRTARIESDLKSIVQLLNKLKDRVTAAALPMCRLRRLTLRERYGSLHFLVSQTPSAAAVLRDSAAVAVAAAATPTPPGAASTTAAAPARPAGGTAAVASTSQPTREIGDRARIVDTVLTLITGPSERLFFSANALLTSVDQIVLDPTTRVAAPRTNPTAFSIAANFSFADLSTLSIDRCALANSSCQLGKAIANTFIGALAEGSSRPFNHVGALIGFRYVPWISNFVPLDMASPFVAASWTRDDSQANGAVRTAYGRAHFGWGISVDLANAIKWLTPSKADATKPDAAKPPK